MTVVRFLVSETAAEHRARAEHLKQIARRLQRLQPLRFTGAGQENVERALAFVAAAVGRGHIGEYGVHTAPVGVIGGRGDVPRPSLQRIHLEDLDEAVRLRVRQRPQQHSVQHAEHRRRRADADRERQHRDDRKGGVFSECAKRVSEILHDGIDLWQPALLAVRFLKLRDAAKPQPRFSRGRFGRHPAADIFFGRALEVIAQLALEVGVERTRCDERPHAGRERQQASPHNQRSGDSFSSRPMTPARRSQLSVWAASCFRPALVMV